MKSVIFILFFFGLWSTVTLGQGPSNKEYLLVDNLDYSKLSEREKQLIDSALHIYHNAKHDTAKFNALNIIIEGSWNEEVWPKYNSFLVDRISEYIPDEEELAYKVKDDLTRKLLNVKANGINNQGFYEMETSNFDKSLELYERSMELAKKTGDSNLIGVCYNNIGHILNVRGETLNAIDYYNLSAEIRRKTGNEKSLFTIYNNIGIIYASLGYSDKALENYFKSLEIMKTLDSNPNIAVLYSNIGDVLMAEEDPSGALEYFVLAKEKHSELNDSRGLALTLGRIADVYIEQNEYTKAKNVLKEAEKIQKEKSDLEGYSRTKIRFAKLYFAQSQYSQALKSVDEGISYLEEIQYNIELGVAYNLKARILLEQSQWDKAFVTAQSTIKNTNISKSKEDKYRAYLIMADAKNGMNEYQQAFQYSQKANKLAEEIQHEQKKESIAEYKRKVDIEVRDTEIEMLNEKNEFLNKQSELNQEKLKLSNRSNVLILLGLVFTGILLFIIFRNFRKQKELNILLEQQRNDAVALNSERESMLKEIHHRVKNNLQLVSSMLRLQSHEIHDEQTLEIFESAQQRILAMALIHEKMYGVKNLKHINSNDYITELVENIKRSDKGFDNVSVITSIEELELSIENIIPIGLVLNELMSNSMKHAFHEITNPKISIEMQKEEHQIKLLYSDNGVGDTSEKSGLGKELISSFVEQLNGMVETKIHNGTFYEFVFQPED